MKRSRNGSTGRPPLTSRATLQAAARATGFAELTVGMVTDRAGVRYSTFYRYFTSLDALLVALLEEVLAELVLPEQHQPWPQYLAQISTELSALLAGWPGMARALAFRAEQPRGLSTIERHTTARLLQAGFDPADALLGASTAIELAIMRHVDRPGYGANLAPGPVRETAQPTRRTAAAPTPNTSSSNVVPSPRTRVDILIDGLESRLRRRTAPVFQPAQPPQQA